MFLRKLGVPGRPCLLPAAFRAPHTPPLRCRGAVWSMARGPRPSHRRPCLGGWPRFARSPTLHPAGVPARHRAAPGGFWVLAAKAETREQVLTAGRGRCDALASSSILIMMLGRFHVQFD